MKAIIRILIGYKIGFITAMLPMILSWYRFGHRSYAHGFFTCLLCWWIWEQRPKKGEL